MSEKKYYWIKLMDNFFNSLAMKRIRKMPGGSEYIIVYLKMQLSSLVDEGYLYYQGVYETIEEEIAEMINEEHDTVKAAVKIFETFELITVNQDMVYLKDVPYHIGKETDSARRVRKHREGQKSLQCNEHVTKCNTDIDIEKDLELDLELEKDKETDSDNIKPIVVKNDNAENKKVFAQDSFEMFCVEKIINSCIELYPNSKLPNTDSAKQKWAIEIDRMKRLDNRSETEIVQALTFALKDSFWKCNIRSTKKFREKFDTLYIKSNQNSKPKQKSSLEILAEDLGMSDKYF